MNTHIGLCRMARIFTMTVAVLLTVSLPGAARTSFGLKTGYITKNNSDIAGLVFRYSFSEHVRIAPQLGVVFRNENLDALILDADMQFPFDIKAGCINAYPLAGIAFNSWNRHDEGADDGADISQHINSLGVNAGAGLDFYLTKTLRIGVEARYTLLRHMPNGQFTASIAYVF